MNPQEELQKRMQKLLEENSFPVEKISARWKKYALKALHCKGIRVLGINPVDLRWMIAFLTKKGGALSLHHFAIISNNLQDVPAKDLRLKIEDYCALMEEVDELVRVWQAQTKPLQEKMESDFEKELMERALAEKQKKQQPFQAVKGQA